MNKGYQCEADKKSDCRSKRWIVRVLCVAGIGRDSSFAVWNGGCACDGLSWACAESAEDRGGSIRDSR